MEQLIIAVDIGNTNTDIGLVDCQNLKCLQRFVFPSAELDAHSLAALNACIGYCRETGLPEPAIAATTVVLANRARLDSICSQRLAKTIIWAAYKPSLPLTIHYKYPEKLGTDRLVDALYACTLNPHKNSIVIDSGTTITVDLIKNGTEFCGGAILPGVLTQLASLQASTDALPRTDVTGLNNSTLEFPGLSTETCMQGGVCVGSAGALNAIVKHFSAQCSQKPLVLATGGGWQYSSRFVDFNFVYDPDLTLIGTAICAGLLQ